MPYTKPHIKTVQIFRIRIPHFSPLAAASRTIPEKRTHTKLSGLFSQAVGHTSCNGLKRDIVRSDADLKTFVRRVEIAERWMGTLAGEKASSAAAP